MIRDYLDGRRDGLKRIPCRARNRAYEKGYIHGIRKSNLTDSERLKRVYWIAMSCAIGSVVTGVAALQLYLTAA